MLFEEIFIMHLFFFSGPTLKIKRFYVLKKYSATIDGLYSEAK